MNVLINQLHRQLPQGSIVFELVAKAPHVFVSESESESQAALARDSKKNLVRQVWHIVAIFAAWFAWLAQASVVRSVAPGARSLQRHEFESLESRRGSFGNVF